MANLFYGIRIITPYEIYAGFRALGFSILFSLGGLLIPVFFSYPTTLRHSWFPDPFFRIYTSAIHKAKHGSDSGVYNHEGHIRWALFDEMHERTDSSLPAVEDRQHNDTMRREGALGVGELIRLHARNRVAADPAGWSFAAMEWWTTWLLLQREGKVWEDDLKGMYDGSLFWRIKDERMKDTGWRQGYGWQDWYRGLRDHGTWKTWEVENEHEVLRQRNTAPNTSHEEL